VSASALKKSVSDMIEVDVIRSFNLCAQLNGDLLNRILKAYAVVNMELEYCQGMNFIAGFLFLVF